MRLAEFESSAKPFFMPLSKDVKPRPPALRLPPGALLREARIVIRHLRQGDFVTNSKLHGWMLARAGISLSQELISVLMDADRRLPRRLRAIVPKGNLQPQHDGLPGFGESQTWRWTELSKV